MDEGPMDGSTPGWGELLRGGNAARSGVVGGGMAMHAINTFIVTTILPTVVRDIGGLEYLAWNTTLYVVASLLGGACCSRIQARIGPRDSYRAALALFGAGTLLCAMAPDMLVLLAGRFVQGLGAGTLSALSFSMIRILFPERLWPRAIAVVSTVWGVATLLGPALGGVFAEYGVWRPAFWAVLAITPLFALLVERCLARQPVHPTQVATRLPIGSLALLLASVMALSVASASSGAGRNGAGVLVAVAVFVWFVRREAGGGSRLMPLGACDPRTPIGAIFSTQFLLLMGMATEIFVPYFLQTLHAMTPLHAGYMSALMSAGWSLGSIGFSGAAERGSRAAMTVGPAVEVLGLAGLWLLMPISDGGFAVMAGIGAALFAIGLGIGLGWPHLCARVYRFASHSERDLASASLTVIVMIGNAFGSAFAGLVTNMAGLTEPGGITGGVTAAVWLYGMFMFAPCLALLTASRVRHFSRRAVSA